MDIPEPQDWGWELDASGAFFRPLWTTAESSVTIKDFTKTCSSKTESAKHAIEYQSVAVADLVNDDIVEHT